MLHLNPCAVPKELIRRPSERLGLIAALEVNWHTTKLFSFHTLKTGRGGKSCQHWVKCCWEYARGPAFSVWVLYICTAMAEASWKEQWWGREAHLMFHRIKYFRIPERKASSTATDAQPSFAQHAANHLQLSTLFSVLLSASVGAE